MSVNPFTVTGTTAVAEEVLIVPNVLTGAFCAKSPAVNPDTIKKQRIYSSFFIKQSFFKHLF
jgi:hypothetical protein